MTSALYPRGRSQTAGRPPHPAAGARPGPPIRVHHPFAAHLVLRTSGDWHHDLPPASISAGGGIAEFHVPAGAIAGTGKPCLRAGRHLLWASGEDVSLTGAWGGQDLYPHFAPAAQGTVSEPIAVPAPALSEGPAAGPRYMRVYLPPDYASHPDRSYPAIYMQDGANLFFAGESFSGHAWKVAQTMDLLIALGLIPPAIVVGIYPAARIEEYTRPGYTQYGRWLADELKPAVDRMYRTRAGAAHTFAIGSSLGGVVSFYLAWQWPEVFGGAACLSPTFGWRDDLFASVARDAWRPGRFYIDSGGPGDNSYAARAMRDALERRGYQSGRDLRYEYFPSATHNESAWAARLHLPLEFLLAPAATPRPPGAARRRAVFGFS